MARNSNLAILAPGGAQRVLTLLLLLPLLTLVPAQDAQANRKSDVITLYNGDRITGEITALLDGRLSLSTDAMGTLQIEWKEVASLASNYNYEVRLSDGQRYFGSLQPGVLPGQVALQDVFGEHSLGWQEVVEIRPVEERVGDRLDIYLAANYAFTRASGVAQTEFNAEVNYNERDAVNSLTSRITVSDTDEEKTTSSRLAVQRRSWTSVRNNFRLITSSFESNDALGLDSRVTAGGGVGRYLLDDNNRTLTGGIGLQAVTEQRLGVDSQESLEAVLTTEFSHWRFDSPEVDLDITVSLYPSLTESGRVRSDSSARLRWELIEDLYWNLNAWGSYDNDANELGGSEFDWGITTGLGWNF